MFLADFKISSPPSWHSGGDEDSDSDVTALLLQGDADAKDLDEDMVGFVVCVGGGGGALSKFSLNHCNLFWESVMHW